MGRRCLPRALELICCWRRTFGLGAPFFFFFDGSHNIPPFIYPRLPATNNCRHLMMIARCLALLCVVGLVAGQTYTCTNIGATGFSDRPLKMLQVPGEERFIVITQGTTPLLVVI